MLHLLIFMALSYPALAQETVSALPYSSVYEQRRSEQLIARGLLHMEAKDFRTAEKTFLDAVQVAKVNYGLRAPQQRAALGHLIEALLAQQKWQLAGDQLSYFEWLNDEIYLRDFYDYLRGTKQLSELLYRASADADNSNSTRYLILAKNLSWRAISAIEATLGETDPELVPWLYDVVLAHYYQVSLIKRRSLLNEVTAQGGSTAYHGWTLAKSESLRISYRIGRDLLRRIQLILSTSKDSPTEASALAVLYQADWELLFGHETTAMTLYGEASRQLSAIGVPTDRLDLLFGRPRVLPEPVMYTGVNELEADWQKGLFSSGPGPPIIPARNCRLLRSPAPTGRSQAVHWSSSPCCRHHPLRSWTIDALSNWGSGSEMLTCWNSRRKTALWTTKSAIRCQCCN